MSDKNIISKFVDTAKAVFKKMYRSKHLYYKERKVSNQWDLKKLEKDE